VSACKSWQYKHFAAPPDRDATRRAAYMYGTAINSTAVYIGTVTLGVRGVCFSYLCVTRGSASHLHNPIITLHIENKKIWGKLILYFPLKLYGPHTKRKIKLSCLHRYRSRYSSVGIETDYGLDDRRVRISCPGRVKNFLFSTSSRPGLGPIKPPGQWVLGGSFSGGRAAVA
jgi:hypothetical protein